MMSSFEIQPFPIPSEKTFDECRIYKEWQQLYFEHDERHKEIKLPTLKHTSTLYGLVGCILHTVFSIMWFLANQLRFYKIQEWTAQKRIETDRFSIEPEACGAHSAFTRLGIARLHLGAVDDAIQCLSASCRVHPCPHTNAYGLQRSLRNALLPFREATEAIKDFDVFTKEFGGKRYIESLESNTG